MELSGKVLQLLELVSGTGKNGEWKKQEFILETPGQYPKKVCITLWGDNIDKFNIQEGEEIKASIDVESREYNGRWYTDVKAWKVEKGVAAQEDNASFIDAPMQEEDDLPF